ncbi:hypothetical protein [Tenggerimyces flavus]|uniref:Uncharacterized protein n=1 Tax=Tenggerimyces flavus TaxID=1708749 RepID=A0ABV7YN53_9ACTN|nr:hypothetical protein [Tenggerimyces flavus]MBM7790408.1 hypothetical protein [Tenggerimyces flavus]
MSNSDEVRIPLSDETLERPATTATHAADRPAAPPTLDEQVDEGARTAAPPGLPPRRPRPREEPRKDSSSAGGAKAAVSKVREVLATAVFTVAVLAALVLALGAILIALKANEQNQIVASIIDIGQRVVGPFDDIFRMDTRIKQVLVNWGIGAAVYLIVGRIVERIIRP